MSDERLHQRIADGELILYRTANDTVRVEVFYEFETFWLDQRRMAELFGVDVRTISEHLRNIYASGELSEEATVRNLRMVRVRQDRAFESDFEAEAKRIESKRPRKKKEES
jgi:hypothetical protein